MAKDSVGDMLASDLETSSRPVRLRSASPKKGALRSRKRRRRNAAPGGIYQRANKRHSW
jgi:hypothetical protein